MVKGVNSALRSALVTRSESVKLLASKRYLLRRIHLKFPISDPGIPRYSLAPASEGHRPAAASVL
jgi:hypothetical protein